MCSVLLKKLKRQYFFSQRHEVTSSIFCSLRKFRVRNSYIHLYLNFFPKKLGFFWTLSQSLFEMVDSQNMQLMFHYFIWLFHLKFVFLY